MRNLADAVDKWIGKMAHLDAREVAEEPGQEGDPPVAIPEDFVSSEPFDRAEEILDARAETQAFLQQHPYEIAVVLSVQALLAQHPSLSIEQGCRHLSTPPHRYFDALDFLRKTLQRRAE